NAGAPDFDQRGAGFPRVVATLDPDNPVIDIGAYEYQGDGAPRGRPPAGPTPAPSATTAPPHDAPAPFPTAAVTTRGLAPAVPPRQPVAVVAGQESRPGPLPTSRSSARDARDGRDAVFQGLTDPFLDLLVPDSLP